MNTEVSIFNTILGKLKLVSQEGILITCGFVEDSSELIENNRHQSYIQQFISYFNIQLKEFDIPMAPKGSEFQKGVWQALTDIPYGETISYGQLANSLGPNANPRNVGGANGANPIAIIIPCHRVIGSDNKLTGYAGGIERKRKLLELEGAIKQKSLF